MSEYYVFSLLLCFFFFLESDFLFQELKLFLKTALIFFLLMATPMASGSSQAKGQTGAAAAGLCYSHSNTRFKLRL